MSVIYHYLYIQLLLSRARNAVQGVDAAVNLKEASAKISIPSAFFSFQTKAPT
jgi:hypothetical protein